jgi:AcrR family transcriptional regulator
MRKAIPGKREAAGLSRERIVDAALALVDETGLAALSTRRLGERLGVEAMSIYHHFPSKHHLLDALVDHAVGSLAWPPEDLEPLARLRAVCHAYRDMAHRFPALFPLVAVHRLNTPTGVAFIERVLAAVQAVEPDPERAARQFRVLGYYLVGAALDETAGYAKGPSAAEPVDDAYIGRHCPRLAASARWFQRSEWDATFEAGMEALMSGFEGEAR